MTRKNTPHENKGKQGPGVEQITISFGDNQLLGALVGEYDRHLTHIEKQLGVTLQSRGNRMVIAGQHEGVLLARHVLEALYNRLDSGLEVTDGDVEGAIRMANTIIVTEDGQNGRTVLDETDLESGVSIRTRMRYITPRAPGQVTYIRHLQDSEMVFGTGPAGTGKTYLAVAMAVSMLLDGAVERIILSRPAVEAGEQLGFLPGDLRDKVDPYLRPLYDALHDMLPLEQVEKRFDRGEIEVAPLAFMRGRTLSNAFVVLDEAQNTTPMQMKMFLTRFGENCRMVIAGDPSQVDLPSGTRSGLHDAIDILSDVEGIAFVEFTNADVVRHPLVGRIVEAYDAAAGGNGAGHGNKPQRRN